MLGDVPPRNGIQCHGTAMPASGTLLLAVRHASDGTPGLVPGVLLSAPRAHSHRPSIFRPLARWASSRLTIRNARTEDLAPNRISLSGQRRDDRVIYVGR